MKKLMVLLLVCALPIAVGAKGKTHVKTAANQDCSECHADQTRVWQEGKHGLMNVKCVVCHGSPEVNFTPKPGLNRCRGCHGEAVADVRKKLPPREQSCFLCHEHHTAAVKGSAKSGFHREGGAQ